MVVLQFGSAPQDGLKHYAVGGHSSSYNYKLAVGLAMLALLRIRTRSAWRAAVEEVR